MDLWFSEVHTPDVKLSLRTAKQLYAGKSEWQDIEVLDTVTNRNVGQDIANITKLNLNVIFIP